jgi:hypothetical protein
MSEFSSKQFAADTTPDFAPFFPENRETSPVHARSSGMDARSFRMDARSSGVDARSFRMDARSSGVDARSSGVHANY